MSKEIKELHDAILRITQSVVVHTPRYSKFGGYDGENDIYTMDIARVLYHEEKYRKQREGIANNATTTGEWISVDERLPENYGPVLVACEGLTIGGAAPIAIGSYGGGFWSLADADGTCYLTKYMRVVVTHWMPLPEAPKGGAE